MVVLGNYRLEDLKMVVFCSTDWNWLAEQLLQSTVSGVTTGGGPGGHAPPPPFTPWAPYCPPPPHLTFDCAPFIAMPSSWLSQMTVWLPPPPFGPLKIKTQLRHWDSVTPLGLSYATGTQLRHWDSVTSLGLSYATGTQLRHWDSVTPLGLSYATGTQLRHWVQSWRPLVLWRDREVLGRPQNSPANWSLYRMVPSGVYFRTLISVTKGSLAFEPGRME